MQPIGIGKVIGWSEGRMEADPVGKVDCRECHDCCWELISHTWLIERTGGRTSNKGYKAGVVDNGARHVKDQVAPFSATERKNGVAGWC
jgi:hypothetical protein